MVKAATEFEKDSAIVVFRMNTVPRPMEFYPVAGLLSDGTVRAITSKYKRTIEKYEGDRKAVGTVFNNGLTATGVFSAAEAIKIFENSNFKF